MEAQLLRTRKPLESILMFFAVVDNTFEYFEETRLKRDWSVTITLSVWFVWYSGFEIDIKYLKAYFSSALHVR